MVKLPNAEQEALEGVQNRTQLLHDYGTFLATWSEFEICIEIAIMRLAGLTPINASIILGGLQFKNKSSILFSLLEREGKLDAKRKVDAVITEARRNSLVHGSPAAEDGFREFTFIKREVDKRYIVKHQTFTSDTFHDHYVKTRTLYEEAAEALGVDANAIDQYGHEAEFYTPTPPRPPSPHQSGQKRSPSTNPRRPKKDHQNQ